MQGSSLKCTPLIFYKIIIKVNWNFVGIVLKVSKGNFLHEIKKILTVSE